MVTGVVALTDLGPYLYPWKVTVTEPQLHLRAMYSTYHLDTNDEDMAPL